MTASIPNRRALPPRLNRLALHLRDPLYRNGYALVLNAGLSSALGLGYWVLVARLYSAQDVGRGSAVISIVIFLSGLAQLNLRPVMGRFLPVAGRSAARLIVGGYLSSAVVAIISSLIFLAGIGIWGSQDTFTSLSADSFVATGFVATTLLWTIFSVQDGVLIGLRQAIWVPVENSLFGIAKIVLAVAIGVQLAWHPVGIIASWVIPILVAVIVVNLAVVLRFLPQHIRDRGEVKPLIDTRGIVRFAAGDYVGALFAHAYASLLPVLVIAQSDEATAGHFYIVWVFAAALQLVPLQLVLSIVIETAADPSSFDRRARQLAVQAARLFGPLLIALIIFAPVILAVFGPAYAEDGSTLLRLLLIGLVPYSLNVLYFGLSRVRARARGIILAQAVLALVIAGLSVLLLPTFGIVSVGWAYLVGQTAVAVVVGVTALRGVFVHREPG